MVSFYRQKGTPGAFFRERSGAGAGGGRDLAPRCSVALCVEVRAHGAATPRPRGAERLPKKGVILFYLHGTAPPFNGRGKSL